VPPLRESEQGGGHQHRGGRDADLLRHREARQKLLDLFHRRPLDLHLHDRLVSRNHLIADLQKVSKASSARCVASATVCTSSPSPARKRSTVLAGVAAQTLDAADGIGQQRLKIAGAAGGGRRPVRADPATARREWVKSVKTC
jgi:hypothetical protein